MHPLDLHRVTSQLAGPEPTPVRPGPFLDAQADPALQPRAAGFVQDHQEARLRFGRCAPPPIAVPLLLLAKSSELISFFLSLATTIRVVGESGFTLRTREELGQCHSGHTLRFLSCHIWTLSQQTRWGPPQLRACQHAQDVQTGPC